MNRKTTPHIPRAASSFDTAAVEDLAGDPVAIASIWADKPTLFVFLRHYG